jgi:hypothetical protein
MSMDYIACAGYVLDLTEHEALAEKLDVRVDLSEVEELVGELEDATSDTYPLLKALDQEIWYIDMRCIFSHEGADFNASVFTYDAETGGSYDELVNGHLYLFLPQEEYHQHPSLKSLPFSYETWLNFG